MHFSAQNSFTVHILNHIILLKFNLSYCFFDLMYQYMILLTLSYSFRTVLINYSSKFMNKKSLKGRSNDAIASACLYIACRQEGVPRTFKGKFFFPKAKLIKMVYKCKQET